MRHHSLSVCSPSLDCLPANLTKLFMFLDLNNLLEYEFVFFHQFEFIKYEYYNPLMLVL